MGRGAGGEGSAFAVPPKACRVAELTPPRPAEGQLTGRALWTVFGALMLYLDSIKRMRTLPADTLVLPSHGRPFKGLHTRVDQLVSHHDERFVGQAIITQQN